MPILLGVRRIADLLAHLPDGDEWLGSQERERLVSMTHPQRRAQFRAGHGYARELLARHGGGEAAEWMLDRDARGAPRVLHRGRACGLHVSLSHSAGWIACAVAGQRIGVDIECPVRERNLLALSESLYPPEFLHELEHGDDQTRRALFFRRWTLDEAHGKAEGHGLRMHALRTQAWRLAAQEEADGWTWDMAEGWLALVLSASAQGGQDIDMEVDVVPASLRRWRRELLDVAVPA